MAEEKRIAIRFTLSVRLASFKKNRRAFKRELKSAPGAADFSLDPADFARCVPVPRPVPDIPRIVVSRFHDDVSVPKRGSQQMIETQPECATEIEYVLEFFTDVLVPLAWPAVAIIGLFLFRSAIRDLLQRIVKAGPSGIEASPQLGNQSSKTLSSDAGDTFLSAAAKDKGLSPWLQKLEQYLKENKIDDNIEAIKRVAASADRRAGSEYGDVY